MTNYTIEKVSAKIVRPIIEKYHYTKSFYCGTRYSYGLFKEGVLVGVICYGPPHSHTLKSSIAGKTYKNRVLELNRLWIADSEPKNTESWFISRSMKLLKSCDILVSFADPSQGHLGIIYQATNWIYTGMGQNTTVLVPKCATGHPLSAIYGHKKKDLIRMYGEENLERRKINGKHRYIYILNRKQKKLILSRMKLTIMPYPKEQSILIASLPSAS